MDMDKIEHGFGYGSDIGFIWTKQIGHDLWLLDNWNGLGWMLKMDFRNRINELKSAYKFKITK